MTSEGATLLPRVQRALEELERAVDGVRLGPLMHAARTLGYRLR